jgi:hypothetical protein
MCEKHTTLLGVIARLVGRGKERQTIKAATRLGDEKPVVRATRLAAKRGEVGGKGAGAQGELRPHAHMAERAAEPLARLGCDDNRGLHIGMDLAVIGERAGFLKSETVGPS